MRECGSLKGVKNLSFLPAAAVLAVPSAAGADAPKPGTPEYIQGDMQSFYYCSGWAFGRNVNLDPGGVGGCSG